MGIESNRLCFQHTHTASMKQSINGEMLIKLMIIVMQDMRMTRVTKHLHMTLLMLKMHIVHIMNVMQVNRQRHVMH